MCIMTHYDNVHQAKLYNQATLRFWVASTDGHPDGIFQDINLTCHTTSLVKSYGGWDETEKPTLFKLVVRCWGWWTGFWP